MPVTDPEPPDRTGAGLEALEAMEEIGRGGFATVYRAFQPRFGRTVAVKLLDPKGDPHSIERFERECAAMGMLSSHPNIVTIFDAGVTDDGRPFLVMEYMPGGTLDDRLDHDGPLAWEDTVDIGVKLAGALETAHEATVLHRDVKPANVLMSPFGEPCLSDFGLARFGEQAKTTGVVTATILHAPPEILDGAPASARSDLYSLGSCLYTLLTGAAPFWRPTDESLLPLLGRISDEPVPDLRGRGIPDGVCAAIERSMAKAPGDRPASMAEFGEALRSAQADAGVPSSVMRVSGRESVAAARRAAMPSGTDVDKVTGDAAGGGATTDPAGTIARPGAPGDDGGRTIRGRTDEQIAPPGATPVDERAAPPVPAKRRRRWPVLVLVALVGVVALAGAVVFLLPGDEDPPSSADDASTTATTLPDARTAAAEITDLVNTHREDEGLRPLPVDRQLAAEATRQAQVAAEADALVRSDLEAVGARHPGRWAILGENVLSGDSVASVQQDSLASSATRDNLDRGDWNVIGVGAALGADGRTLFVVEYFAQRIEG